MSSKFILIFATALVFCLPANPARAFDTPDEVSIDLLAELYQGVSFDHTMHTELGEDCSVCHHHTTGTGTTAQRCTRCHADSGQAASVACRDCHSIDPFSAETINLEALDRYQYHIDTPGLKAAYHWKCVGCHEQMGGPDGCQDCHARTAAGDAFYHADASGTRSTTEHDR